MRIRKHVFSFGLGILMCGLSSAMQRNAVADDNDQPVKDPTSADGIKPTRPTDVPFRIFDPLTGEMRGLDLPDATKAYQHLAASQRVNIPPYWIGVQCEPVDEVPLLSDLPDVGRVFRKGGLRVTVVVPDSPAEKSEVIVGDVIIKAGDVETKELVDLLQAVGKAKEGELQLRIIRDEKPIPIAVTPRKRPEPAKRSTDLVQAVPRMEYPLWPYYPPMAAAKLPEDVELTYQKRGDSPAKITIKRGEKSWNVAENELQKLPADVRQFVQQLVSATRSPQARLSYVHPQGWRNLMVYPAQQLHSKADAATKKRLDEISEQLEQLRKAVDELKQE